MVIFLKADVFLLAGPHFVQPIIDMSPLTTCQYEPESAKAMVTGQVTCTAAPLTDRTRFLTTFKNGTEMVILWGTLHAPLKYSKCYPRLLYNTFRHLKSFQVEEFSKADNSLLGQQRMHNLSFTVTNRLYYLENAVRRWKQVNVLGRSGKWQYEIGEEAPRAASAASASSGLMMTSASSVRAK